MIISMKAHEVSMQRRLCRWLAAANVIAALFSSFAAAEVAQKAFAQPPSKLGWLVLEGGGKLRGTELLRRFIELAGGKNARLVVIPSAAIHNMGRTYNAALVAHETQWWRDLTGIQDVTLLHTDDRTVADSKLFVAPLRRATALFILGGDDAWLYNIYVGTRTQTEIHNLFERGGAIGGTSAGATVLGATTYDLPTPRQGFNLLKNTSVNPHFFSRHREADMAKFVQQHPAILGIGVDESTAVFIHGSDVEVVGEGNVGIFDGKPHGDRNYILFSNGDKFDLQRYSTHAAEGRE
jgi:cyanophycinase